MFVNCVLFVVSLISLIYFWLTYHYGHWKRKNIPGPEPKFFIGNLKIGKVFIGTNLMNIYNAYKSHPLTGIYLMTKKALLINDLDLVKNILIKDHHPYFEGHGGTFEANADPITQHLFNLEGEKWKKMRVKLTPTFTSNKMKMMYDTLFACTDEMVKYLDNAAKDGKAIDFKDIVGKLGTDVIASCAFGIESNSFKDENAEFRRMGKKILILTPKAILSFVLSLVSPKLADLLIKERFSKDVSGFFYRIVRETVEYREKNGIRRNDFMQLLIDMKNNENPDDSLTLVEMTAQVLIFFIAGFETSSTTASFALLELMRNKESMQKALTEMNSVIDTEGGKITYDSLNKMTYLTQIINETLRLYPPISILLRRCTEDYQVPGMDTIIEKGTVIAISPIGIQRDPDIYPNPMKFDPERFSQENIKGRHPCAHIPFGEGPRICIGARFGIMQVKLALVMTLRNFDLECVSEIPEVITFNPKFPLLNTDTALLLKLTRKKL